MLFRLTILHELYPKVMTMNDKAIHLPSFRPSCSAVQPTNTPTIHLPKALLKLLALVPIYPTGKLSPSDCTTVADTGAIDHMFPNKTAFISYHQITHLWVCMGTKTYAPILGRGTAINSLNGHTVLVHNALHVSLSTAFTPTITNMAASSSGWRVWGACSSGS